MKSIKNEFDTRSLRYFISVAENLSFSRVAAKCHITQSAMSTNIAKMEEDLGFDLFIRHSRKVKLTPAGKELYKSAKEIMKIYDSAVTFCSGIANGTEGSLTILLPSYPDSLRFIDRLKNFQDNNPNIMLVLRRVDPRDIRGMLDCKEADIAFCWPYDFQDEEDYVVDVIDKSPICVALSKEHKLANTYKSVKIEDLEDEKFLAIGEGSLYSSFHSIYSMVLKAGIKPSALIRVHNLEEILIYIEMNYGIALFPRYIEKLIPPGRIEFRGIEGSVPIAFESALIYLKRNPSSLLLKFIENFNKI